MTQDRQRTRLTNTIFVTQSMFSASQIAIFTLLSIMAVKLSGLEEAAGLPSTAMTVTQSLVALPIGIFMGRAGRRLGLSVSYSVSAMGALLGIVAILQGSFPLLLLSAVSMGAGRAGADQSRYAAGDMFPEGIRARMIGRVVFAGTIGAILGPLLVTPGTQLAQLLGLDENIGPWVIGLIFYLLATLITLFLLHPDPLRLARVEDDDITTKKKKHTGERTTPDEGRSVRELMQLPLVRLAVLSMLISQGVMVALMVITPVHMSHHNHGQTEISLVISAHTLGMYGLSSLTGYLIDRLGAVYTMMIGAAILILSAIIAPLSATMPFLVAGLFLLGLGWNMGYIAGSSLLSDRLRGLERNRMQGTSDMLVAGAAAIGSLSSGPLFSAGDYGAVAFASVVIVLLLVWFIRLYGLRSTAVNPAIDT